MSSLIISLAFWVFIPIFPAVVLVKLWCFVLFPPLIFGLVSGKPQLKWANSMPHLTAWAWQWKKKKITSKNQEKFAFYHISEQVKHILEKMHPEMPSVSIDNELLQCTNRKASWNIVDFPLTSQTNWRLRIPQSHTFFFFEYACSMKCWISTERRFSNMATCIASYFQNAG